MTKPTRDQILEARLGPLDPAGARPLENAERDRADALFARIVATDPTRRPDTDQVGERPERRRVGDGRRAGRRILLAGGLALAATAIVVPAVTVDGGRAYASWTPEPVTLTGTARAAADDACLRRWQVADRASWMSLIAERRGEWSYVLLQNDTQQATCMMAQDLIENPSADNRRFFGGFDDEVPPLEPLGPTQVAEYGAGTGNTAEGLFGWTEGAVGSEVVGLTVTTGSGIVVTASVVDGRYAAWWPSRGKGVASPELTGPVTMRATLADGTVVPVQSR